MVELHSHGLPAWPSPKQAVSSGSLSDCRCFILLITCLFEDPMGRCMVAKHARLHLLMPATTGTGRFPPAIAPRASQPLAKVLAQLSRCRYLAQQREQRVHLDQLADYHHVSLHVVVQLPVGNLRWCLIAVERLVS